MREKYLAFLNNIWQDPLVLELIESGYIFVLPERDSWGRRVVWSVARRLDPARHNTSHVVRAHIATFEVGDNILQHCNIILHGWMYVKEVSTQYTIHIAPTHKPLNQLLGLT